VPLPDGSHPLTLEKIVGKMTPFEIDEVEVFSVIGLEEPETELGNLSSDKLDVSLKK